MKNLVRRVVGAFERAYSMVIMVLGIVLGTVLYTGCAGETFEMPELEVPSDTVEVFIDRFMEMEKILNITTGVKDTLAKSEAEFIQDSYLKDEQLEINLNFSPEAYVNISLSEKRIEVKSFDELPVKVTKSYIKSQTPFAEDNMLGKDVVKVFEFSDGQVATVSFGERYYAIINDGDTLAIPHTQINDVVFVDHELELYGEQTELEKPYKLPLIFSVESCNKGTSNEDKCYTLEMKPWYLKVITIDPRVVLDVDYEGGYVGCPYEEYRLTETVTTNKGTEVNEYSVPVSFVFKAPNEREQPSLDSLFADKSVGKLNMEQIAETKTEDGFVLTTNTGTYVSTNTGKENKTSVSSSVVITAQYPVRFENENGKFDIPEPKISFDELGFDLELVSEEETSKKFKSTNSIVGKIDKCTLNPIDELVYLIVQKEKAPDVVKVDSTYVEKGSGDEYIIEKEIIWSDGSKEKSTYTYNGRHSFKAVEFGEKITTSLNWDEEALESVSETTATDKEAFSDVTWFEAVYTTSTLEAKASNGNENGTFGFVKEVPVVTFVDGDITIVFDKRDFSVDNRGADVSTTPRTVIRDAITYNAYEYDYVLKVSFDGDNEVDVVSDGLLLVDADEVGMAVYDYSQTWSGNTITVKVTKTIPHSHKDDEVFEWSKSFTVGMTSMADGKVYADNTNFKATEASSEDSSVSYDNHWTVTTYERDFIYEVSNGVVKRDENLKTTVTDAIIIFDNGEFSHTFDVRFDVDYAEKFGNTYKDGYYDVTPHNLTVTGVIGSGKSLSVSGKTDIYVRRAPEVTGHSEKTVVYDDGTVDAFVTITKDDGTSTTFKASDVFGKRFAFNFANTTAKEKVVSNVNHTASGSVGTAVTTKHSKGDWVVTEYRYPYNHKLSNSVTSDDVNSDYGYSNFEFVYNGNGLSNVKIPMPTVEMSNKSLNITENGLSNGYFNYDANVVVNGYAEGTEGSYSKDLRITHILKIVNNEPEEPHFGKPRNFIVTASFDPTSKVTRRAFVFNWEEGVTYAICDYETMLPTRSDFYYKEDTYKDYNSVSYVKSGSGWSPMPAKAVTEADMIAWYDSNGTLLPSITYGECMYYGWKNIVNGKYALYIDGYSYTINGYEITVTAPNGETVTFDSHYEVK